MKSVTVIVHLELNAIREQLRQSVGTAKEMLKNTEVLRDLLQAQLDRLEEKVQPKVYTKEVSVSPVTTHHSGGHIFSLPRLERKGMNHTASSYSVCLNCGRSDVSLQQEVKDPGGNLPPCRYQR